MDPTPLPNRLIGKVHEKHRFKRITIADDVVSYENNPGGIVGCYIHRFPLTEENNYFEIKILDAGRRGTIAIGVTPYNYPLSSQPGWSRGSAAYHADDGNLYQDNGFGTPFGPKCVKGDVMGCGIRRSEKARPQGPAMIKSLPFVPLEVFFTRNGKEVGDGIIFIVATTGDLYPAVGLHSVGESIQLSMNPENSFPFGLSHLHDDAMLIDREEEEDWVRITDVIVNGQVIEYSGNGKSIRDVGMALARKPLNTTTHYFEVEIMEPGQHCYIAIGLVHKNYPRHRHPGWNTGSVAYHADDGQIFLGKGQGVPFGPRCYRGDVMGCGIWFPTNYESLSDGEDEEIEIGEKKKISNDDTAAADIQDIIAIEKSSDGEDSSSLEDEDAIDLFEDDDWQLPIHDQLPDMLPHPLMGPNPFRAWKNMRRGHNRRMLMHDSPTHSSIYGCREKGPTVRVFFTRNGQHIGETSVLLPKHGFYPAVGMLSADEKVKVDLKPLTG